MEVSVSFSNLQFLFQIRAGRLVVRYYPLPTVEAASLGFKTRPRIGEAQEKPCGMSHFGLCWDRMS